MFMRILDRVTTVIAGMALIASTLLVLINVANRYLIQGGLYKLAEQRILPGLYQFFDQYLSPFSAMADEVPGLLLAWVTFLGAYLAMRDGGHIAFDMLLDKLSPRVRQKFTLMTDTLIGAFLVMLFYQACRMIMVDGSTEIETAEIGQGWFMSVLVIFSVLMLIATLHQMFRKMKEY
ncbi:TRAP transporter small permease [Vibrio rhizosphaerae]|uniref:TRAP transporter small permease protein n=1 Tax=Vibrio rhizosphaerae TaxID=398736 RepID=A0ABU4IZ54_9VIBR|nr:TRAP transporter small permease subunit [Vibrio rhizosphaerae]MDW6093544.1 TRAP transporter small permease subunit [Vibrio rhizosphaerae]